MENNNNLYMGIDISTKCIGISLVENNGSEYGKVLELTHISPKVSKKTPKDESIFIKCKLFEEFIVKYKDLKFNEIIIEKPLLESNNSNTVGVLLSFNGMISNVIYTKLGIVPKYISSYDARKYSFPELMAIRKYNKSGIQYDYDKILKEIKHSKVVLFGSYSWEVDKKTILQEKVADIFPEISWIYDKKGELRKENYDATDSYVAVLGYMHKLKNGELKFNIDNIQESEGKIEYDVHYWNKTEHRITYAKK